MADAARRVLSRFCLCPFAFSLFPCPFSLVPFTCPLEHHPARIIRYTFRSAMLSRLVTLAVVWFLTSGAVPPLAARLPAPVEDAIRHVTAAELRGHITI